MAVTISGTTGIKAPTQPVISGRVGSATDVGVGLIGFDEFWETEGITYDSGTKRFTVPHTGRYRIVFNGFKKVGAATTRVLIGINTDSPTVASNSGQIYDGGSDYASMIVSVVHPLTAGDYIVFKLNEGTLYNTTNDRFNNFSIEFIG